MKRYLPLIAIALFGCDSNKMPPPVNRHVDYVTDVQPLLQKNCYSCHGPMKQKGSYRLDDKSVALKPEVIKSGDSANSPLIHHLLGINDRRKMPPEGEGLNSEQVGILRAWIDQGAPWSE